jgi:PRC-barrel domain
MAKSHNEFLTGLSGMGFAALIGVVVAVAAAQVGGAGIGATEEEMNTVMQGWNVKKQVLGRPVYNEYKQKLGIIDDLIITRDHLVSYVIIEVGGFLGVGKHEVAISMSQLTEDRERFILPTATRYVSRRCQSLSMPSGKISDRNYLEPS